MMNFARLDSFPADPPAPITDQLRLVVANPNSGAGGGAGGDRTHDGRLALVKRRANGRRRSRGSPRSTACFSASSALPRSARFARLPVARSLAEYGEASS
jgi:hypothetical protein